MRSNSAGNQRATWYTAPPTDWPSAAHTVRHCAGEHRSAITSNWPTTYSNSWASPSARSDTATPPPAQALPRARPHGSRGNSGGPPGSPASLRLVWRFLVDIPHELRQAAVPQQLPDRHVLAGVIPVVIDHALHQGPEGEAVLLAVDGDRVLRP